MAEYRLLQQGESLQPGDETYNPKRDAWVATSNVGVVPSLPYPVRRAVPATSSLKLHRKQLKLHDEEGEPVYKIKCRRGINSPDSFETFILAESGAVAMREFHSLTDGNYTMAPWVVQPFHALMEVWM